MARRKVQLVDNLKRVVFIDPDATDGATIGVNVFNQDGSLFVPFSEVDDGGNDLAVTIWRYILEIPPNVVALENAVGTGLFAVTGPSTGAFRAIQDGPGVDWTNGDGVAGDPQPTFNSETAPVPSLFGSTYDSVQDIINLLFSPGIITGGEVTALDATTVRVTAGTAILRVADDDVSQLVFCDFGQTDFVVPDVQTTHFYAVDYNAGSPVVVQDTVDNWNRDTQIPVGSAFRLDGALNVTPNPYRVGDVLTNLIQRLDAVAPVQRDNSIGGVSLGASASNVATLSAGRLWSRVSDFPFAAKSSDTDSMFSAYFNGTNLTITGGHTTWDNQNYNNGTTLSPLTTNNYANLWFFISFDGTKWGYAYGTGQYATAAAAQNEDVPAYLTQNFFNQALLVGRYIFRQGDATPTQIESVFDTSFATSVINEHNDLNGLQGGSSTERYHQTAAQNTSSAALASMGNGLAAKTGAGTWEERSFPDGTGYSWTNADGVAGDPTLVLSSNLQSWSAISTSDKYNTSGGSITGPVLVDVTSEAAQSWRGGGATYPSFVTGLYGWHLVGPTDGFPFGVIDAAGTSSSGVSGGFIFRKARGTIASPASVNTNDLVGQFQARVYGSTGYPNGSIAAIQFNADGGSTDSSTPGKIRFLTCPSGSTASALRWTVESDGKFMPGSDNAYDIGSASLRPANLYAAVVRTGAGGVIITSGSGSPEGVVVASVGSMYTRTDGGAGTTLYVKESGSGSTGWAAK